MADYTGALLKAMSIISENNSGTNNDKTIKASIISVQSDNQYTASYNGGKIAAYSNNSEKYNKLLWLVCSRPFDKKQLLYDDLNILRILDLKIDYTDENELIKPEWLEDYKQRLVEVILYQDRHPDENKYLSLMRQLYKDEFIDA